MNVVVLVFDLGLLSSSCYVQSSTRSATLSFRFRFFCTSSHPPFPPCTLSLGNLAHSFARSYILLTNFLVSSLYRDFSSSARTRDFFSYDSLYVYVYVCWCVFGYADGCYACFWICLCACVFVCVSARKCMQVLCACMYVCGRVVTVCNLI